MLSKISLGIIPFADANVPTGCTRVLATKVEAAAAAEDAADAAAVTAKQNAK